MTTLLKCFRSLKSPALFLRQAGRPRASSDISHYEAINRGEQEVPKYFNFASDVLDKWAQMEEEGKRPPNAAFWWVDDHRAEVKWSFRELGVLSRKAANVLLGPCGLQRGDRVVTILPRIPEWWLLNVACMRAGLVFLPGTSMLTMQDISYRLQASKAKCVVVSDALVPVVDSVASECSLLKTKLLVSESSRDGWLSFKDLLQSAPAEHNCVKTKSHEPMVIYFTSGSTGSPKMAVHSHCSYGIGFAYSGRRWLDLTPSDVFWNTSDTGWVKSAWSSLFIPWIMGSCVFVHHLPKFDAGVIFKVRRCNSRTLATYPITTFCTATTAYRMLVQQDLTSYKFMSLRHCVTGGEPLNPEVAEQWKTKTGLVIHEGYGQSETATICANVKGMKIKQGSMGKGCPPYDVQVVDDLGNINPPGEEGDIAIRIKPKRPFSLFLQYLDNPEKTAATERGNFYITGDRGMMDEEGYVWFVGRSDDVINSAGYRIGPFEVESALQEHPAVTESAVVSSPDPVRGEVVKAFIVLSPAFLSHDPEKLSKELQEHVKKAQYEAVRRGDQQLPEHFNFASDVLDKWSQMEKEGKRPSSPALWWINGRGGEVRWSFEELGVLSRKVANTLLDQCGLRKGDRILVILPRIPEWWLVTVACIRTGIVFIPGTTQLTAKDIQYRLQMSKAKCIITTDVLAPAVDSVAAGCGHLQSKLMVSEGRRDGWLNFNELLKSYGGLTPSDTMWCTADTGWVLAVLEALLEPWVSGSSVFVHHLPQVESTTILNDNPEKTAAVERGPFYVTGDRGIMDSEGYFWFSGRADDIINSAGYRIGPFDVESALLQHPAVAEAAAVSSPDPLRGEVVKAFVVLALGYASEDKGKLTLELQEHVKKVTAPYKYPRKARKMAAAVKLLSRLPVLKSVRTPTLPSRFISQACSGFPDFSDIEPLFEDVPEHFNFAGDVLDKWSQKEQVCYFLA
ncbi:hypothetical protein lerEdw1_013952 [Lerista edwardsae]|nr:hypothetical protein lerEdw1_013952 [Lerista edwardsae]